LWRQGRELKKEYLNAFTEASFDNGMALLQLDIDYLQRIIGLLEEKQEES
jgi:hypothetical protein